MVSLDACEPPNAPENGMIECDFGSDGIARRGETCAVTCNDGFKLKGSGTLKCGRWFGKRKWFGIAVCKESKSYNT